MLVPKHFDVIVAFDQVLESEFAENIQEGSIAFVEIKLQMGGERKMEEIRIVERQFEGLGLWAQALKIKTYGFAPAEGIVERTPKACRKQEIAVIGLWQHANHKVEAIALGSSLWLQAEEAGLFRERNFWSLLQRQKTECQDLVRDGDNFAVLVRGAGE